MYDFFMSYYYSIFEHVEGMVEYFEKMIGLKAMHTPIFNAFLHEVMSEPRANSDGLT